MRIGKFLTMLILLGFLSYNATAQSPKQSKKRTAKAKKSARKAGSVDQKAYLSSWYTQDEDGDGVANGRDKCPRTPKGETVTPFGCPIDTDFDGLYDYEDACPTEAGPKENKGCPWGDRDGDGIKDNEDDCPDLAGVVRFRGCPDTDGDGIPDQEDKCPTEKGPRSNKGCPFTIGDSDGDGLPDNKDKCPLIPGPVSNFGCPELKPEEKAKLQKAFENLLFETGKDIIKSSSFPSLNDLADVLKAHPEATLLLEGHTDNVGDDDKNMQLSKDRAASTKRYLVDRGVSDKRIKTEGYGETKPVDTNDTPQGRTKNRRVEMKIIYE